MVLNREVIHSPNKFLESEFIVPYGSKLRHRNYLSSNTYALGWACS